MIDRRTFSTTLIAGVATSLLGRSSKAQAQSAVSARNVVLVHGAYADGSCWSEIIPLLTAKGFKVSAVQLPLSAVAEDVAAATRIINAQDGPVLLVGHSYGGAVITEAGNNPKVAGLVYVAAFAPEEGESPGSLAGGYPPTEVFSELNPIDDGYLLLTQKGVYDYFAQDLAPDKKYQVLATQGATQGAIFETPIGPAAWHSKPSWFIIAENDKAIQPQQEMDTAKRMGAKTLTLQTSHLPMLAEPAKVADFMIQAAATLSGGDE